MYKTSSQLVKAESVLSEGRFQPQSDLALDILYWTNNRKVLNISGDSSPLIQFLAGDFDFGVPPSVADLKFVRDLL